MGGEAAAARIDRHARALRGWLFDSALPLWRDRGADRAGGAFEEALLADGSPLPGPRRFRVQARQVFTFATAGRLGWAGDWREAAAFGLRAMERYRRPDGLYRYAAHRSGEAADDLAQLYEQAFALLAFAAATRAGVADRRREAAALLAAVTAAFGHPEGGFREASDADPFQSNPLMHLFEASLAWVEVDAAPPWTGLADDLARLCLTRFVDGARGALRESFDAHWRPLADPAAQRIEPGHQFEWAWLVERWSRLRRHDGAHACALALFRVGEEHGVDAVRSVAIDALNDDLTVQSARARLWPQTERIKAALLLGEAATEQNVRAGLDAAAADACEGLGRYLGAPLPGLFRDKYGADGRFLDEPSPATSLYHIMGAAEELSRRLDQGGGG